MDMELEMEMAPEMQSPNSPKFSVPIDQCVLDQLPDFDDFDDFDDAEDCYSEGEYSLGDDLSLGDEEEDDCNSLYSNNAYSASLYTIIEETEEDLMSECTFEEEESDMSDLDCSIQMTRSVSLDERRQKSNNIFETAHHINEETDESESSLQLDEALLRRNDVSSCSFASQDDDVKSVDSSSTAGSSSFRLAKRRLQKELSLIKLKQVLELAELSSSFRKDERNPKCMDFIEQTLLKTTEIAEARNNLLSVTSSSDVLLTVTKE